MISNIKNIIQIKQTFKIKNLKCQFNNNLKFQNKLKYSFSYNKNQYNDIDNPFSSDLRAFQINIQNKKTAIKTSKLDQNLSVSELKQYFQNQNIEQYEILDNLPNNTKYSIVNEGNSMIIQAENSDDKYQLGNVFYSPAMINERNISLAQAESYIKELQSQKDFQKVKIANINVDSGIRSLRYYKELDIENIEEIHSLDINQNHQKYMEIIKKLNNIENNDILKIVQSEPNNYMRKFKIPYDKKKNKFDIIDIESHGSSIKFIEYAIKAAKDGGLIMATFTDLQILSGPFIEKCARVYGTQRDRRVEATHEVALRTALYAIYRIAAIQEKYIEPILSYREDFFIRIHFKVYKSKQILSKSMMNISNMYNCSECPNFFTKTVGTDIESSVLKKTLHVPTIISQNQIKCEICNSPMTINGPLWLGPLNNTSNVNRMIDILQTEQNNIQFQSQDQQQYILYLLSTIQKEENFQNTDISFSPRQILKFLNVKKLINKEALIRGYQSLGFSITQSYLSLQLYKTNAPRQAIFDIFKQWKKVIEKQREFKNLQNNTPANKYLIKKNKYIPEFRVKHNQNLKFELKNNQKQVDRPIFSKPEQAYYGPSPKIGKYGKK